MDTNRRSAVAGNSQGTDMKRLEGKVAIVTGGASGLGKAICVRFAEEGARVILTDINPAGEAVVRQIGATWRPQDVTSEDGWRALVAEVTETHGRLDVLVNNAGIGGTAGEPTGPETANLDEWRKVQAINVEGVWLGCKYALPAMRDSGGGSIINMSSLAALTPTPFITAYGVSKAGVQQLSRSVALHGAGFKVRCNSIHPGVIETPMEQGLPDIISGYAGCNREDVWPMLLQRIPLGYIGQPVEVANAALFLASDEARYITGVSLPVDGGSTLV